MSMRMRQMSFLLVGLIAFASLYSAMPGIVRALGLEHASWLESQRTSLILTAINTGLIVALMAVTLPASTRSRAVLFVLLALLAWTVLDVMVQTPTPDVSPSQASAKNAYAMVSAGVLLVVFAISGLKKRVQV